ncbi:unnamed protein product [Ilex paraguariensis]|uniref:GRAM domain-containing protein n=1 Tax=Ilex paraguariensis TaxID=185542 RepID=A0ABC8SUX4_9AQUA
MAMPRTRSGRSTSLHDSDSRLYESEKIDALEWTKIERVSRSVPLGVLQFLLEAEQVIVEGYGVVLVNTDEAGTLFVTNFRLLFLVAVKSAQVLRAFGSPKKNVTVGIQN